MSPVVGAVEAWLVIFNNLPVAIRGLAYLSLALIVVYGLIHFFNSVR